MQFKETVLKNFSCYRNFKSRKVHDLFVFTAHVHILIIFFQFCICREEWPVRARREERNQAKAEQKGKHIYKHIYCQRWIDDTNPNSKSTFNKKVEQNGSLQNCLSKYKSNTKVVHCLKSPSLFSLTSGRPLMSCGTERSWSALVTMWKWPKLRTMTGEQINPGRDYLPQIRCVKQNPLICCETIAFNTTACM